MILAIDPGPERSAYVLWDGDSVAGYSILDNYGLIYELDVGPANADLLNMEYDHLAIEGIASYGMAVGREVFDTCIWIGRFMQAYSGSSSLVYRKDVKLHLCGSSRAKDGNVRQALIDRFGPGKEKAIGRKAKPGPLYGISSHCWSALAVAVTWLDTHQAKQTP